MWRGPGSLFQLADQLRAAFFGTTVSEIQRGPEAYEIDVRIDPRNKDSLSDLDNFTIKTVPKRLRRMKEDPLLSVLGEQPDLMAALEELAARL